MMKVLYKTVKVIYNAHLERYEIYYRNWFRWHLESCYAVDKHLPDDRAKEKAIGRAQALLNTVEVFRQSNIDYYHT
jgi:hypothetical protein